MEVQNVSQVDYLAFFSTELPKQLAEWSKLRDELQQRQGAMSAVVEANAMRQQAEDVLRKAQSDAEQMRSAAQAALDDANSKRAHVEGEMAQEQAKLAAILEETNAKLAALSEEKAAFAAHVKASQDAAAKQERDLASRLALLESQQKALSSDRSALEFRIKKFSEAIGTL